MPVDEPVTKEKRKRKKRNNENSFVKRYPFWLS